MQTPIHVAIPVYNNCAGVRTLLAQLLQQDFASITILDDASTDDLDEYLATVPSVEYIRSEVNLGTVGANNLQLLSPHTDGYLLCIDSDMQLVTEDIPQKIKDFVTNHPDVGAFVGRIEDTNGNRIRWNFNYDINPWRSILAFLFYNLAIVTSYVPYVNQCTRRVSNLFTSHLADDVEQKVDWGIEGFFVVRNKLWQKLQGFDTSYKRFHEGPDLFLRLRKLGYSTWYTPTISARDTNQASHSSLYRAYHWWRSTIIYFIKHPSRLLLYYWPRP